MTSPYLLSVVVPAHNEASVIGRCLESLARQDVASRLEVVVAANGCSDETVEIAEGFKEQLPGLVVLNLDVPSKTGALNAADRTCTTFPRVYLDADIELGPQVATDLLQVLRGQEPAIAAPSIVFDDADASPMVRRFYNAYERTPYVREGLVGLGMYALNAAGRARFGEFPALVADDLFVQRHFGPAERRHVSSTFTVRVPRTLPDLVRVRTRVAAGNRQLVVHPGGLASGAPSSTRQTLVGLMGAAVGRPALLPSVAVYLAVVVVARVRARHAPSDTWWRDESTRPTSSDGPLSQVAYLVSQYPSPSHTFIEREVAALRALGLTVQMFSVRSTPPEQLLTEAMEVEATERVVLQNAATVLLSIAQIGLRHPLALVRALGRATRLGPPGIRNRIWQCFYVAEGVNLLCCLQRLRVRHVHVHFANNAADIARAAMALGRDVDPAKKWTWSFTMHGPTEFENVERFDLVGKVNSADAVACISDFARSQLMRHSNPASWNKLQIVPMSVDIDRFHPVVRRRAAREPLRVLFVGRLVAEKGPSILIEALDTLRQAGIGVTARIVGAGPLFSTLQRDVDRRHLGASIHLLGALGQDDVIELYRWADVFCLPSFQEGLPVALMEALASGLPVLTTSIAGIPELVQHGVGGVLVPPGRADLVSAALADLNADPALRQRLGEQGREVVVARHSSVLAGRRQAEFLSLATRIHI